MKDAQKHVFKSRSIVTYDLILGVIARRSDVTVFAFACGKRGSGKRKKKKKKREEERRIRRLVPD